jgi:PAS domain S-box-containing protein
MSLAVTTALAVPDLISGTTTIPVALLIVGPLIASARSSTREVAVVAAWALVLAIVTGAVIDGFTTRNEYMRAVIILAGGALTVWTTSIRQTRERTADLLAAQAAVARILASCNSLADAAPRVLQVVGDVLTWERGSLWAVRPRRSAIARVGTWSADGPFTNTSVELARGEGLAGQVWHTGQPAWSVAAEDGRFGFAFPVLSASGTVGAIEFSSSFPLEPDRHVLDLMDVLGGQVGEYVERRRAEDAVQESEVRKRAILDASLDALITIDDAGTVVEFNPAAERIFGYDAQEAIGADLADLVVPPKRREPFRSTFRRYLETGRADWLNQRIELNAMRKDGSTVPVEVTFTATAGDPPMFTGYVRDVTERRRSEDIQRRLALIVESSEDAILSKDRNAIITSWNRGAENLYGYTAEEAIGSPVAMLVPDHLKGEDIRILNRILADERLHHYETTRVRKDGGIVEVELSVSAIKDTLGNIVGASVIAHDITERKRIEEQRVKLLQLEQEARLQLQQAERQASFVAEAQSVLSSSLDYATTLESLARISVPYMGDWCIVDVIGQDGALVRLAVAHAGENRTLIDQIRAHQPRSDGLTGSPRTAVSGESQLVREVDDEFLTAVARDEEHLRVMREMRMRSVMIVPLRGRERVLGSLIFASAESARLFDEDDLVLAEDLASRAAIAVDNARLYGERSYIAATLQQALLPDNLPEIPGVELAARYLAAGEGAEVGGDFYDIYRAGESTWGLAIGDVRGKGPRAAAVTALARYTMRTASLTETSPSRVLQTLNEAMLRQRSDDRFCTVAYASIQPSPLGGVSMKLGVGGHPLPLLLRADGSVERVGSPGTLIGLVPDPDIIDVDVELHPGESLILYTDGVSEARSLERGLFGEERLIELLRGLGDQHATGIAEQIEQQVLEFQNHASADDLAVLVMRVREDRRRPAARRGERFESVRRPAPA